MIKLTAEKARELLEYDPETGILRWRVGCHGVRVGDIAGSPASNGYILIGVGGKRYSAHRLAWLITFGEWPQNQIDHRNGDTSDNRICNLREATPSENQQNRACPRNNISGHQGVNWDARRQKWRSMIYLGGRPIYLGRFDSLQAAVAARADAKVRLHQFNPIDRAA